MATGKLPLANRPKKRKNKRICCINYVAYNDFFPEIRTLDFPHWRSKAMPLIQLVGGYIMVSTHATFLSSRHPTVKWAQRSDKVFITIELPDAKNAKLTLQPDGRFYFSATSGPDNTPYEVELELFDKVDVEESKASIGLRNICYLVKKAVRKWWSRLSKQEGKPPIFLKVDWDKWIDEDDEKDNQNGDMGSFGDMDFSKLGIGGDDDFDMNADNDGDNEVGEAKEQTGAQADEDVEIEETNTSGHEDPLEAEAKI